MDVQPFGLHLACNCGKVSPVVFHHKALPGEGLLGMFGALDGALGLDIPKPLSYAGWARCQGCGNRLGGVATMTLFCDNPCEDCKLAGTAGCCKVAEGVVCGEQNCNAEL